MEDAEIIASLFKLFTDSMRANNVYQWHYKYPLIEHVVKDIQHKTCYVFEIDGKIAGTITIDSNQDVQYKMYIGSIRQTLVMSYIDSAYIHLIKEEK